MIRGSAPAISLLLAACPGNSGPSLPALLARPKPVDFGTVVVGTVARAALTIENTGPGPASSLSVEPAGELAQEVRADGVPATLPAGQKRVVELIFAPAASGARRGEVIVRAEGAADLHVPVFAVATVHPLAIAPEILDFGRVAIGASKTASVTVSNRSDRAVKIRSIAATSATPEIFASIPGIVTLLPGESVAVQVRYRPQDGGLDEGVFVVADDAAHPEPRRFTVRGEGIAGSIFVDPDELSFLGSIVGRARTRTFSIRNLGLRIHTIDAVLPPEAPFSAVPGRATPVALSPGDELTVTVTYAPDAPGAHVAEVWIAVEGEAEPQDVDLIGSAQNVPAPRLAVSPAAIDFGAVDRAHVSGVPRRVWLRNAGVEPLVLTGVTLRPPGSFDVRRTADDPDVLAPGDEQVLEVYWLPSAGEPGGTADLAIASTDPAEPEQIVPVAAQPADGAIGGLEVEPKEIALMLIDTRVAHTRAVILSNPGNADVLVTRFDAEIASPLEVRTKLPLPFLIPPGGSARAEIDVEALEVFTSPLGGRLQVNDLPPIPITVVGAIEPSPVPIRVALDIDDERAAVDLHVARERGAFFDRPADMCFCNPDPLWAAILVNDRTAEIRSTSPARYAVRVHLAESAPRAVLARVVVHLSETVEIQRHRVVGPGQRWEAGAIVWTGNGGFFEEISAPLVAAGRSFCY